MYMSAAAAAYGFLETKDMSTTVRTRAVAFGRAARVILAESWTFLFENESSSLPADNTAIHTPKANLSLSLSLSTKAKLPVLASK